jgi:hypothetical protein
MIILATMLAVSQATPTPVDAEMQERVARNIYVSSVKLLTGCGKANAAKWNDPATGATEMARIAVARCDGEQRAVRASAEAYLRLKRAASATDQVVANAQREAIDDVAASILDARAARTPRR